MTKNRIPTPVYLDPGMHPGLEVKGLIKTVIPVLLKCLSHGSGDASMHPMMIIEIKMANREGTMM